MELFPHQKQVLEQIKNKNKCALYLDMGLGKTFIASEKMKQLNENLNIIVCPKSVVNTWENHIKLHYPEYQVLKCIAPKDTSIKTVVIINYDLIWRREDFLKLNNYTLILDESQFIKNSKASRTKFIMKMKCKNLILCSGTPTRRKIRRIINTMQNAGLEYYKNNVLEYVYRLYIDKNKWIKNT